MNDNKKEDLEANSKSEPPKETDIKIVLLTTGGGAIEVLTKFKA